MNRDTSGACRFGAEDSRCLADASLAGQCAGRGADAPLSLIPNQNQTPKATSSTSDVGLESIEDVDWGPS